MLLLERPRKAQPRGPASINGKYASGLVAAVDFSDALPRNLVNGQLLTTVGSPTRVATAGGLGWANNGSGANGFTLSLPATFDFDHTIAAVVVPFANSGSRRCIARTNAPNSDAIYQDSGFIRGTQAGNYYGTYADKPSQVIGVAYSQLAVGVNGIVEGSFGGRTSWSGTNSVQLLHDSFSQNFNGAILFFGVWSRSFYREELADFSANPWEVFAPRRILVPVTGAGGTDATATGTTQTATAALIAGSATGEANATATGQTLTATSSLLAGAATGEISATASGITFSATASLLAGAAAGAGVPVLSLPGVTSITATTARPRVTLTF